ncbi:MAG: SDR family oxidoreductase [Betaproteobacteria bacterium]
MRTSRSTRRILIVGFGDIGERVAKYLRAAQGVSLSALVRNVDAARHAKSLGVRTFRGDLSRPRSLQQLAGAADVIFHFAPPPAEGVRDLHTRNLLAALSLPAQRKSMRAGMLSQPSPRGIQAMPQRLVYISTTGVYGDCGGEWIDETRELNPQTDRARRRVDAERSLRMWGRRNRVAVSVLRAPGIYAAERLPLERLRKGTPALRAEDDVFTNHIHADDLARAAIAAMRRGKPGRIYNAVDDSAMTMGAYFDCVAEAHGLRPPPRISRAQAKATLSPALVSFMSESRRIRNVRLKRELRFVFRYAAVEDFLLEISVSSMKQADTA